MTAWTPTELAELDRASEVRVAGRRADGSSSTLTIVWHVVVDGNLYLRSVKGPEGQWYRGVAHHFEGFLHDAGTSRPVVFTLDHTHDTEIDDAYFAKYGRGAPSRSITSALARQTTLRVDPR
ncbi:hypothetical protein EV140_0031 [Microcella alkaliphila]|uniref:DUF2255 family protein n=1 Tax=Microcella alkaliphila TaxID=279828 RepID=A0A4Q7TZT8_9MICO|nr:DUF2255 family protein [Microcella alkaliphila]RZT66493.1 hypothetical protein EV140_0031 [Microcella alkaliphila]